MLYIALSFDIMKKSDLDTFATTLRALLRRRKWERQLHGQLDFEPVRMENISEYLTWFAEICFPFSRSRSCYQRHPKIGVTQDIKLWLWSTTKWVSNGNSWTCLCLNTFSVVITGASRGIGRSWWVLALSKPSLWIIDTFISAQEFAKHGATGFLLHYYGDAVTEKEIQSLKQEIIEGGSHRKVEVVPGDIADPETSTQIVSKAVEAFGRIDVLVSNAGLYCDIWNLHTSLSYSRYLPILRVLDDATCYMGTDKTGMISSDYMTDICLVVCRSTWTGPSMLHKVCYLRLPISHTLTFIIIQPLPIRWRLKLRKEAQ